VAAKVRLVGQRLADSRFERTKLVINHLPNYFIILHTEGRSYWWR
jgi:hypothetical protein